MKKRDLTTLALMGIAMGLCGGPIEADDSTPAHIDEHMFAQNCGGCGASPNQQQPQAPQQKPQNGSAKNNNGQYQSRQTAEASNEAWMDEGCGTKPSNSQQPQQRQAPQSQTNPNQTK